MEKVEFSEVIRQRRTDLGLSQSALASAVGVDKRQIRRYEAGEQQPVLGVAVAIANALGISLSELAGLPSPQIDLGGRWWAAWQTFKEGQEVITCQEVNLHHQAQAIQVHALTRGIEVAEGGYLWREELKIRDNEILMGWYAADDGATRSKGTMYFVLHSVPRAQTQTRPTCWLFCRSGSSLLCGRSPRESLSVLPKFSLAGTRLQ
jgi:transcriptional regulator with XRE-family HTH domain